MSKIQLTNVSKSFLKSSNFWQKVFLVLIAFSIWMIFYPGLMSPDSMAQYEQAHGGYFNDWHPPFMSIVLWLIIKLGGDIGALILIQCVAAILGLRTILCLMLEFISSRQINKSTCQMIATIVTILFLIPLFSPFMFYSVIFWKDAWIAISLLWIISYLLWMFLNIETFEKQKIIIHIVVLSLSAALLPLIRHNALIMLPIICLCLTIISITKFGRLGVVVFALPLILAFIISPLVYYFFHIQKIYLGNSVIGSDLATMVTLYPELKPDLPIAARHQYSPILLGVDVGLTWDDSTEGKSCPINVCESALLQECYGTAKNTSNIDGRNCYMPVGTDNPALKAEYLKAATQHPLKFISTKLYIYWQMLHPRNWENAKFVSEIYENKLGLVINDRFTSIREYLFRLSTETGRKIYFNWISGMHIVWLAMNIFLVIYALINTLLKRTQKSFFLLSLLLVPLAYYFSYLLATATSDYRYMYPSTLVVQIFSVSLILSNLLKRFRQSFVKNSLSV